MKYALIELNSGLLWGIEEAADPAEACRQLEERLAEPAEEYIAHGPHYVIERGEGRGDGYAVYEIDIDIDPSEEDALDLIHAHGDRVAVVECVREEV